MNKFAVVVGAIALFALSIGVWWMSQPSDGDRPTVNTAMHGASSGSPPPDADDIVMPDLTPVAMNGKRAFEANCAVCHGQTGAGTNQGPPLIHEIYEPSHHGDASFLLAAKNGVRAHHWRYGDMPPVEGLGENQVAWIVKYVREVQRANGIE